MKQTRTIRAFLAALVAAVALAGPTAAGQAQDDWCARERWGSDREGACEVRELTVMPGAGMLTVDAAPNGGITVAGSPRGDVLVRARIVATAETEQRAREILDAVRVESSAERIHAEGPTSLPRRESWHVSYDLAVPPQSSLSLNTTNGGINIRDVEGRLEFRTVNGGVKLSGLAGDVRGRTSNGGVDVDLDGPTWNGNGLDVETSNGGVRLRIPDGYSARLETGTVNGGFNIDFPVTVQGRMDRELKVDLGSGGPLIRVRTNNGGVRVSRR
ncbi:MAG TPA: DUF4097 family beta strand repeat-containing protein [Vicinamibacterales bacterium]|nr:DUF4097 family beta strand repeat-containing protein [Vicinamibacterales bacterium]